MQSDSPHKPEDLRAFRNKKGLSQADLAIRAHVSQSTVSRRERKAAQRHSEATNKLCSYARVGLRKTAFANRKTVKKWFDEVWNKSGAHAAALSKIIEAFVDLSKSGRDEGEPVDE